MSLRRIKPTKWRAPSMVSDQPGHPPVWSESLLSTQRNLASLANQWVHSEDWSDWANAQADLSLCWAHMPFCWFCDEVAHMRMWEKCDREIGHCHQWCLISKDVSGYNVIRCLISKDVSDYNVIRCLISKDVSDYNVIRCLISKDVSDYNVIRCLISKDVSDYNVIRCLISKDVSDYNVIRCLISKDVSDYNVIRCLISKDVSGYNVIRCLISKDVSGYNVIRCLISKDVSGYNVIRSYIWACARQNKPNDLLLPSLIRVFAVCTM